VGPYWYRADFVGKQLQAWARLGPLGTKSQGTASSHGRFVSRQFRRDRSPNGVAWRFPDWTAVGFRFDGLATAA
jgi:hypothetical protein